MENGFFVKEIKPKTKGKYEVSLEGGEPLILYGKELNHYNVKEGQILPEQVYEQIISEVLSKRATKRAMHLMEKMDRTEHDLRDKLRKNGYPTCCIDAAVAYLESYHYLDDRRYAENYIRYRQEKESKRIMKQKLMQKGVDSRLIDECLEECCESDELELVLYWLRKRKYDPKTADLKEKQRTYAFLMRKGFSSSLVATAMRVDAE